MTGQERYAEDPQFRALVETIYSWIERLQYTPSEVRDAAMVAATMYDVRHIRPSAFPPVRP